MVDFKKVDPWILWFAGWISGVVYGILKPASNTGATQFFLQFFVLITLAYAIYRFVAAYWRRYYQNKFYGKMFCVWHLVHGSDDEFYETECGQAFFTGNGTPHDNGMKYCPYCGRGLVAARVNTKGEQ